MQHGLMILKIQRLVYDALIGMKVIASTCSLLSLFSSSDITQKSIIRLSSEIWLTHNHCLDKSACKQTVWFYILIVWIGIVLFEYMELFTKLKRQLIYLFSWPLTYVFTGKNKIVPTLHGFKLWNKWMGEKSVFFRCLFLQPLTQWHVFVW